MALKLWPVVELFGPTIQGEGPDAGTPCHFIRFGGCDYRCGYTKGADGKLYRDHRLPFMCDSLHAVLPEEVRKAPKLTLEDIMSKLDALSGDPQYVVLSGGNPALLELSELVDGLHLWNWKVAIETQGTRWRPWINDLDTVVISPKPPSAGQPFSIQVLDNFLRQTLELPHREPRKVALKVPIFDEHDLRFADAIAERYDVPMYLSIVNAWVPDASNPPLENDALRENLLRQYEWVAEHAQDHENLTTASVLPQMHVLVWGNEKER